jgi:hypothetical protein
VRFDPRVHAPMGDTDVETTVTDRIEATAALRHLSPRNQDLVWSVRAERRSISETAERPEPH